MVTLKGRVTEEDIASGVRCDSSHCPIARSVDRASRAAGVACQAVSVGLRTATLHRRRAALTALLPKAIGRFREEFDAGAKVEPTEWEMEFGTEHPLKATDG